MPVVQNVSTYRKEPFGFRQTSTDLYPTGEEAGSAAEDRLSSGFSSVEERSIVLSETDEEAAGAAGAVELGAEVEGEGEGCGVATAVLGCKTTF